MLFDSRLPHSLNYFFVKFFVTFYWLFLLRLLYDSFFVNIESFWLLLRSIMIVNWLLLNFSCLLLRFLDKIICRVSVTRVNFQLNVHKWLYNRLFILFPSLSLWSIFKRLILAFLQLISTLHVLISHIIDILEPDLLRNWLFFLFRWVKQPYLTQLDFDLLIAHACAFINVKATGTLTFHWVHTLHLLINSLFIHNFQWLLQLNL